MIDTVNATRQAFVAAYRAALDAVDPYLVTRRHLSGTAGRIRIGGVEFPVKGDVRVLAVGKGAHGMAAAAVETLGDRLAAGLIISDQDRPSPHPGMPVMVGDHPYPGRASLAAGRAALKLAAGGCPDETLLVLVSGGGSALMEVPAPGVTFEDLQAVGRALVTGGAPITEMNVVRRHLSSVKNGGVAAMAGGRDLFTLLISDVVDGPASAVASGPTLSGAATSADARAVLADHRLEDRVPPAVLEYLENRPAPSPESGRRPYEVIADGLTAAEAARRHLEGRGRAARVVSPPLAGEAETAARTVVAGSVRGLVKVYWGETTVRITGPAPGRGGRNQHAALVAAGCLSKRQGGVFGAFATDGIDGASRAAGGLVDAGTVERGRAAGLDRLGRLRSFDSSSYLEACGDLIVTGPTGANVGDLWLASG